MRTRSLVMLWIAVALLAAACAKTGGSSAEGSTSATSASVAASAGSSTATAPASSPTVLPSPLIEDGKNFAFVKSVDVSSDPPTITYDLAYFLTGDAATQAAKDHGDEYPPPNDYYIVNDNPRLRTVPLAAGARLVLLDWNRCCDKTFRGDLAAFAEAINTRRDVTVGGEVYKGVASPYWLVARNGQILRIQEQFLP